MSLVLLGLFGPLLIGALAFDWFEGDENTQSDDHPPEEAREDLSYDGSDLLEGTEKDDTLSASQDESLAPDTINLLGGNDTATIEVNDVITVSGGEGDDVITATGVLNVLEGGAGNDTLTADDSNQIFGGEGDDVLNFIHGTYDQGDLGVVNGGEGNDVLNLRAEALIPVEGLNDFGGVNVVGERGADAFNIVYDFNALDDGQEPADDTITRGFIRILDFDPSEDSLLIEVERDAVTAERDVQVELDQTAEDGTYRSLIKLTFAGVDGAEDATNILTVLSTRAFTLDDIQLVSF